MTAYLFWDMVRDCGVGNGGVAVEDRDTYSVSFPWWKMSQTKMRLCCLTSWRERYNGRREASRTGSVSESPCSDEGEWAETGADIGCVLWSACSTLPLNQGRW